MKTSAADEDQNSPFCTWGLSFEASLGLTESTMGFPAPAPAPPIPLAAPLPALTGGAMGGACDQQTRLTKHEPIHVHALIRLGNSHHQASYVCAEHAKFGRVITNRNSGRKQ